jgi:hypothetical protein
MAGRPLGLLGRNIVGDASVLAGGSKARMEFAEQRCVARHVTRIK